MMENKPFDIKALTIEQIAQVLSKSSRRSIPVEYVRRVAEDAQILRADGTVNLIEYTAFLAREVKYAR